jgi:hypothetical protein
MISSTTNSKIVRPDKEIKQNQGETFFLDIRKMALGQIMKEETLHCELIIVPQGNNPNPLNPSLTAGKINLWNAPVNEETEKDSWQQNKMTFISSNLPKSVSK